MNIPKFWAAVWIIAPMTTNNDGCEGDGMNEWKGSCTDDCANEYGFPSACPVCHVRGEGQACQTTNVLNIEGEKRWKQYREISMPGWH